MSLMFKVVQIRNSKKVREPRVSSDTRSGIVIYIYGSRLYSATEERGQEEIPMWRPHPSSVGSNLALPLMPSGAGLLLNITGPSLRSAFPGFCDAIRHLSAGLVRCLFGSS